MNLIETFEISHKDIFLLEIYHQYRYCALDVSFVCHFWVDSDSHLSFRSVLISFEKIK